MNNFCDYNCLCFTETHLDNSVDNANILLTNDFSVPYRKDRTNHGGGILVYINNNLLHKRRPDLEIFCEESIWVEIKINNQQYLLGTFYSPKPHDQVFFEAFDRNIEKAIEFSQNIVIIGDLNEDLLNENYRNLRDILLNNKRLEKDCFCIPCENRGGYTQLMSATKIVGKSRLLPSSVSEDPGLSPTKELNIVTASENL